MPFDAPARRRSGSFALVLLLVSAACSDESVPDAEPSNDASTSSSRDGSTRSAADGSTAEADGSTDPTADASTADASTADVSAVDATPGQPTAIPVAPRSLDEDSFADLMLTGTDSEDREDQLVVRVRTTPVHGSLTSSAGAAPLGVRYVPASNYNGADALVFTVTDRTGAESAPVTVQLDVRPVADAPNAIHDTADVEANTASPISVLANDSDPDGDPLMITSVTQGRSGSVSHDGARITYTPAMGFEGRDQLTYTISDGAGGTDTASVAVRVIDHSGWYGLGGSDLGPWSVYMTWASATAGGMSNTPGGSVNAAIAVDGAGRPVVAWEDGSSGDTEIYVARWNPLSGAWEDFGGSASRGGISDNSGASRTPAIALDANGDPVVVWADETSGDDEIYIKRWRSSRNAWELLGPNSATGSGITSSYGGPCWNPALALDAAGNPAVAFEYTSGGTPRNIPVHRFNAATNRWEVVGGLVGISTTGGDAASPSIAIHAASGEPIVAWEEHAAAPNEIYVKRWSSARERWEEVGAGSATGGGVSDNRGNSFGPSLALDGSGNPVVAWSDTTVNVFGDIYVRRFRAGAWQEIGAGSASGGGISDGGGVAKNVTLALATDDPIVMWQQGAPNSPSEILVRKWSPGASRWEELGAGSASARGISDNPTSSESPALALGGGVLVAAWTDGEGEIYVRRERAGVWEELGVSTAWGGGISDDGGRSHDASLAITASGDPIVAWEDYGAVVGEGSEVFIRGWRAGAWAEIGAGSASGGGVSDSQSSASRPLLALDSAGNPIVVWQDTTLSFNIYARRWNGALAMWEPLGTSDTGSGLSGTGDALSPSLALDANGDPVVAWVNIGNRRRDIMVSAWDPAMGSWTALGSATNSDFAANPRVAVGASGGPIVAFDTPNITADREIVVRHRDAAGAWAFLGTGGVSRNRGDSSHAALVIDGRGDPIVAWQDSTSGDSEIYVRRLNPMTDTWDDLGAGAATGGGVSDNSGDSVAPALAVDASGAPIVAWQDASSGNPEIYVRRFTRTSSTWEEIQPGSATGGGVSNSAAPSLSPSVASRGGVVCVAWHEAARRSTDILLRCAR